MSKEKTKIERLRELVKQSSGQKDFIRKLADEGLIVSMGEGRRYWHSLQKENDSKELD